VRAVQQEDGARRSGPGRWSGDCPAWLWWCWRGCALVYGQLGASEMVCLSVCLRLKLTSGRAWERETNTEVPLDTSHERESLDAPPHTCPRSRLTAMRLVSMHGHLTSCSSAQASLGCCLVSLHICVHATVWSLFEALGSTCCITLNAQHAAVTSYSNESIPYSQNTSR
jgi:hypothetical protein